jgi:transcription elongation factor Elf1
VTRGCRERRQRDRRGCSRGGRRATDVNAGLQARPACPTCGQVGDAQEVKSAENGWWLVCGSCNHFWNERERSHAFLERCARVI